MTYTAWVRGTDARGRPTRRRVSWDPALREFHAGGRPLACRNRRGEG